MGDPDARPGRQWFDAFMEAQHAVDVDAVWALLTRASHELVLRQMADAVVRADEDEEYRRLLEERLGADVSGLEPRAAWNAFTRASCESIARGDVVWRYLGEETDGERVAVRLTMVAGTRPLPPGMDGELVQVLVREDGAWRLDKTAS